MHTAAHADASDHLSLFGGDKSASSHLFSLYWDQSGERERERERMKCKCIRVTLHVLSISLSFSLRVYFTLYFAASSPVSLTEPLQAIP